MHKKNRTLKISLNERQKGRGIVASNINTMLQERKRNPTKKSR
jgi:hypothetical protein